MDFIQILGDQTACMETWERGAGRTLACGTGATGAAVVMYRKGMMGPSADIRLLAGTLHIDILPGRAGNDDGRGGICVGWGNQMNIELGRPEQRLLKMLESAGISPVYLVGGYVRNKLLFLPEGDRDIASPFPPQALKEAESSGNTA